MRLITDRCTGCGYCVLVCPYDALKTNGRAELTPVNCTDCNLCVYACPSDCFIPEPNIPLKPYATRARADYDVIVVGSGLGGLMAGAALAQAGRSVAVFEKLGFPGGRYTELDYRGAAVTTGAWTNLGPRSHIGRFLTDLEVELTYISLKDVGLAEQYSIRFPDGRRYAGLFDLLSPQARKAWLKAIVAGRKEIRPDSLEDSTNKSTEFIPPPPDNPLDSISALDYLAQFSSDPDLLAAVEAIVTTASGLPARLMPASEYIQIILAGRAAGLDFAMPAGGVRAIIKALARSLRRAGGELFLRSPVDRILVEHNIATGVRLADGRHIKAQEILHNGGPARFLDLVGAENLPPDYVARLTSLERVDCAALFCATRAPLFAEAPIVMTPGCRRVVGIFSPTRLDPSLSKHGLHLVDAFFPLHTDDRPAELELALADMRDLFPRFDDLLEWMVPMFFTGAWPGTESGQTFGQTGAKRLDPATPIENCYLVGMDVRGSGVAGDLIPLGVRRMLDHLGVPFLVSV